MVRMSTRIGEPSLIIACGIAHVAPMSKCPWCCNSTCQDGSNELDLEWICPVVVEFQHPKDFRNPYHTHGHAHVAPMGKWPWCCISTGQDGSNERNLKWIHPVGADFQYPQGYKHVYYALGYAHVTPMGKWLWCCMYSGLDSSNELNLEWISPVVAEI